jgi:hypothetical protein
MMKKRKKPKAIQEVKDVRNQMLISEHVKINFCKEKYSKIKIAE